MSAYVIAEVEVTNPDAYEDYRKGVPATLERYGGRFIVRGGAIEPQEGDWRPSRLVVIEFSSMDHARTWYNSPEYEPLKAMRHAAATSRVLFVGGVS